MCRRLERKWVQYGPIINIVIGYILIFIQYKLLFLKGRINNLLYMIPIMDFHYIH